MTSEIVPLYPLPPGEVDLGEFTTLKVRQRLRAVQLELNRLDAERENLLSILRNQETLLHLLTAPPIL